MGGRGVNWQHRREACEHRQAGRAGFLSFFHPCFGWMDVDEFRSLPPHL